MPRNGSGVYTAPAASFPAVASTLIESAKYNDVVNDIATAVTASVAVDGQSTVTANIPLSGYKLTGVGAATARTDAATLATIQDGTGVYVATVGGTADVITLTPSPAITAYAAGEAFKFIASGANTTNVTVNVSALGAKAVTKNGSTALVAGDIPSGALVHITYDGTRFQLSAVAGAAFQPLDATLTALAGLTIAASSLSIGSGADAFSQTTFAANTFPARASTGSLVAKTITDFGLSLVDDANAAAGLTTLGITVSAAATQAEQETGTATTVAVTPGRQQYHDSACKAWVKVGGEDGTPDIQEGYNVSSITDNGAGDYTVNFTTAFSAATYSYGGLARAVGNVNNSDQRQISQSPTTAPATGSCRFVIRDEQGSFTLVDADCAFQFYGDQ